jgi:hypothetical protein
MIHLQNISGSDRHLRADLSLLFMHSCADIDQEGLDFSIEWFVDVGKVQCLFSL